MAFDKKAYNREYARAHREKMNAAVKKWRKNHPEERKKKSTENARKWREKNREKYNAYHRAWRAKQKELAEKKDE